MAFVKGLLVILFLFNSPKWLIDQVEYWRPLVREVIAERERHPNLTEELVLGVIAQESYGNPDAQSWDEHDSRGLMQVTCFEWMEIDCDELFIPEYNIQWGIWFLDEALRHCGGKVECALRVYNCGPDRAEASAICGRFYASKVLEYYKEFEDDNEHTEGGRRRSLAKIR